MKKILLLFLVLLFLPLSSVGELNDADLDGLWTCYIYEKDPTAINDFKIYQLVIDDNTVFSYLFYLDFDGAHRFFHETEYTKCIYTLKDDTLTFKESSTSDRVLFTGWWSAGNLYISFDGHSWYRFFRSDFQYATHDRFTAETVPEAFPGVYEKLEAGYQIPAGIYTIGKDIPAGDYELQAVSSTHVVVKLNRYSSATPTEFNIAEGATFGKISLEPGMLFSFSPGSLILKNFHGLFD